MLTLYHAPRSRSSSVLWLLEELGEPYDVRIVNIRRADGSGARDPALEGVHPHAKAPALVHDGITIFERPAIFLYLTDTFPKAELGPKIGDAKRGPYLTWLAYVTGVIEPAAISKRFGVQHVPGPMGWAPIEEIDAHLNKTLEAGPWLLGAKFSAADILIAGGLSVLVPAGLFPKRKLYDDYLERAVARPAFARAQAREDG